MSANPREVSQTPSPLQTPLGMAVQDKTLFDNYAADECYSRIGNYLNEHGIPHGIMKDFDFKRNLAPKTDPLYTQACQSRARSTDPQRVADYAERFRGGERVKYPPILAPTSNGRAVPMVGNHRSQALASAGIKSPVIVIDISKYTSAEVKDMCAAIAAMSNTEGQYSREEDTLEDITLQVGHAYRNMMSVDLTSRTSFTKAARTWRSRISAASTPAVEKSLKKEWFTEWMDREKPYSFTASNTRGRIFNQVFSSASGMYMSAEDHYTDEALQDLFKDRFTNSTWDPSENQLGAESNIHQLAANWTNKEPTQHIRRTMHDKVFLEELKVSQQYELWLVIWGSPMTTTVKGRTDGIASVMKKLRRDNLNPRTPLAGYPMVTKVLFPQALACDQDTDYAYQWNPQDFCFDEV